MHACSREGTRIRYFVRGMVNSLPQEDEVLKETFSFCVRCAGRRLLAKIAVRVVIASEKHFDGGDPFMIHEKQKEHEIFYIMSPYFISPILGPQTLVSKSFTILFFKVRKFMLYLKKNYKINAQIKT